MFLQCFGCIKTHEVTSKNVKTNIKRVSIQKFDYAGFPTSPLSLGEQRPTAIKQSIGTLKELNVTMTLKELNVTIFGLILKV